MKEAEKATLYSLLSLAIGNVGRIVVRNHVEQFLADEQSSYQGFIRDYVLEPKNTKQLSNLLFKYFETVCCLDLRIVRGTTKMIGFNQAVRDSYIRNMKSEVEVLLQDVHHKCADGSIARVFNKEEDRCDFQVYRYGKHVRTFRWYLDAEMALHQNTAHSNFVHTTKEGYKVRFKNVNGGLKVESLYGEAYGRSVSVTYSAVIDDSGEAFIDFCSTCTTQIEEGN